MGVIDEPFSCGEVGSLSIHARLAFYADWIARVVNSSASIPKPPTTSYECKQDSVPCGCGYVNVEFPKARVVGGLEAVPYSWPMMVSIRFGFSDRHTCGGSILDETHILTAAHCVDDESLMNPVEVYVTGGMHDRFEFDGSTREVGRITLHPQWNVSKFGYLNDIAILTLTESLEFVSDSSVYPTCLPPAKPLAQASQYPPSGTQLVLIGWGSTGIDSDKLPNNLQQAMFKLIDVSDPTCRKMINDTERQFCAGLNEGGKGKSPTKSDIVYASLSTSLNLVGPCQGMYESWISYLLMKVVSTII